MADSASPSDSSDDDYDNSRKEPRYTPGTGQNSGKFISEFYAWISAKTGFGKKAANKAKKKIAVSFLSPRRDEIGLWFENGNEKLIDANLLPRDDPRYSR